jgi:hypothetical protein
MTQVLIRIYGMVFILVGTLGVLNKPLLGIFEVDAMHNIIHLVSGLLALIMAATYGGARMFAQIFGTIYGLVTIIGFINGSTVLGLFTVNPADNYLHLVLTIPLLIAGFFSKRQEVE